MQPTEQGRPAVERKRIFEIVAIVVTGSLLIGLSRLETRLFGLSETLAQNPEFFSTVVHFSLINFYIILFLVLGFLIFRNVAKLVVERRRGVFGSSLRRKLVLTLMLFTLLPTSLMFYVSYQFIITSFDEWFSDEVTDIMQDTREAGAKVYRQDQRRLESLARIALGRVEVLMPEEQFLVDEPRIEASELKGFETQYGLDNIKVFGRSGDLVWSSRRSEKGAEETVKRKDKEASRPFVTEALRKFSSESGLWSMSTVVGEDQQDVVKGVAPVVHPLTRDLLGIVMTETRFETQILKSIEEIQSSFSNLRPGAQLIKLSYLILLVVMTLLIVFSAVWLGFYVARGITGPIQLLAEATREVALGNYNVSLTPKTDDEAGQLIRSFNKMTQDLERHRSQAAESREALLRSNEELEQRRKYMEVVLKNITAGVISVEPSGTVTSVNSAAESLLNLRATQLVGRNIRDGLGEALHDSFWKPVADRLTTRVSYTGELDLSALGRDLNLLVDGTRISDENGEDLGIILVFDDVTERVKVQRAAAWREVARRIAHEIKNPVTPIKLSAERLLRRFNGRFQGDEQDVFHSCVETILKQSDSLRDLVNEFSKFSRLPQVQLKPADINDVILDVVNMYRVSYPGVEFNTDGLGNLPEFPIDKDQMNRVFVNLISNAVAAVADGPDSGRVELRSMVLRDLNTVRIEVLDNGVGIPEHLRDRVLEPYYSTKDEGTGLGLAIANQIVSDHGGYLRILAGEPRGTKIVIELPLGVEKIRRA